MKARTISAAVAAMAVVTSLPQVAVAQVDRLAIHGYMTQGYGRANGGIIFGIPEDGTTDYRNAALQFRYQMSPSDALTLQLSHRKMATSSLVPGDEYPLRVDWAFYTRRFGDLDVKVGRVAIPAGIYNEVRDVGVLLPFYRAPFNFYFEGAYTSETVDGVVASYTAEASSGWSAHLSAFGGEWDMTRRTAGMGPTGPTYVTDMGRATGGYGGEAWINTPVEGVRFGGGASRYAVSESLGGSEWTEWHWSADITRPMFTAQAEMRRIQLGNGHYRGWYGYLGVRPIPELTFQGMAEFADLSLVVGGPVGTVDLDVHDAFVVGARYALSLNVVLKAEAHRTEGFQTDAVLSPMSPPVKIDFLVVSLATAF